MGRPIAPDSTDVSVSVYMVDRTTGLPDTGIAYNDAGMSIQYRRGPLGSLTTITAATLAAVTTAHADGGFIHERDGQYRVDLTDAAVASGVDGVELFVSTTDAIGVPVYFPLNFLASSGVTTACASALSTYDGPTNAEMVSAFTEIKGATWAAGTDTLEKIRDKQTDIETDTAEIGTAGAGLSNIQLPVQNTAIVANVTKVNSITVGGAGTDDDPWGPA